MSDDRKDLPPANSPNFLEKVREALSVYLGNRGNALDRGVTVRDLTEAGIANFNPGYRNGSGGGGNPLLPPPPSDEPDLTPPPTPTGFTASAAISNIVVQTDSPVYTQGHGHQKSRLYGSTLASPVFADAVLLTEFPGNIGSYATNPATTWHLWITWVSNDGVESLSPAGGTNGVVVTTGQNVATLLTALAGQIAASQLDASLTSRVNLIDGATGLAGSVNARLDAQNTSLSAQIASVAVGTGDGFDSARIYYFDSTVDGWTGSPSNPSVAGGYLKPADGTGTYIISPSALAVASATYSQVKMRLRKVGTPTWAGKVWWADVAEDLVTAGRSFTIPSPTFDGSGIAIVTVTPGWTGNIDRFRVDLVSVQDASNYIEIDWIGVGRSAPGASVASVQTESSARQAADGALYAQYTVKVDTAGLISGFGLASTANNAAPFSQFGVRANQFYIAPPATSSATAPSSNLFNGYTWFDTTTSTTKFYRSSDSTWQASPTSIPFAVQTTPTTINGVSVPPGVYMDAAFISDGTITNAKIGNAAIDDAKISNLSVTKLLAGSIGVGQHIQSTGYVAGLSGWKIHGNGTAEFGAAMIRDQLTASQIDTRGLTVKDGAGTVILSSGVPLGSANMATGRGGNLLQNSDFLLGNGPWVAGFTQFGAADQSAGRNLGGDPWRPLGGNNFGSTRPGIPTGVWDFGHFAQSPQSGVPVVPGVRYEASAYLATHRSGGAQMLIAWFDSAGTNISAQASSLTTATGGPLLENWGKVGVFAVAPAGATNAMVVVRTEANGGSDPYTWVTQPMFCVAGPAQTEFTPWSAGNFVEQITSGNASTYIASAAIGTAQIANAAITNALIGTAAVQTANINDAAITNAKIGALAVGSANIADAAITNAKIGTAAIQTANIEDANITTLKIGANQVTIPVGAKSSGSITLSGTGGSATTSLSLSIDTGGSPLFVDVGVLGTTTQGGINGSATLTASLSVNSVQQYSRAISSAGSGLSEKFRYSTPAYIASPGSGSITVQLTLTVVSAPTSGQGTVTIDAGDIVLFAIGTKR